MWARRTHDGSDAVVSVMTAERRWGWADLEEKERIGGKKEGRPTHSLTLCAKVLRVCKKAISHFRGQSGEGHWSNVIVQPILTF